MKAISFGWTSAPLLAGEKTVTRRNWNERYAESFKAGERCWALDKVYFAGGKRIAVIELTEAPYIQLTGHLPWFPDEWKAEGFAYMEANSLTVNGKSPRSFWDDWVREDEEMWVVRFRLVETL